MRRCIVAVSILVVALAFAAPVSAASATIWRATIVGQHLHGGATTVIRGDGTGTVNVKLYGVTPGVSAAIAVNAAACPTEAQRLFSFEILAASSDGIATGKVVLTASQLRSYNAGLTARTPLSILAVTPDDKGCGDQQGAPRVGTGRAQGRRRRDPGAI